MRRDLIFLLIGAAIGGAAGYVIAQRQCENILQEEIDEVKKAFGRPYGTYTPTASAKVEEITEEKPAKWPNTPDFTVNGQDPEKVNYKKLIRRYDLPGAPYLDPVEEEGPVDSNEDDQIHVIPVTEFFEARPEFEKTTLYYYEDDEVLVNEAEEVQVDKIQLLGELALDSFGEGSEDPEIVYVRNERFGVDYEVTRLSKSYAEAHGIDPIEDGDLDGDE